MAIDVTAFTALARSEFMNGMLEVNARPIPANYDAFVTSFPSKVRVETHTYMSQIPRLREFKGWSPGTRLVNTPWTVANVTYRAGPIEVTKEDLDDDQLGGYMQAIKYLPKQAQKDIGFKILSTFASTTGTCFDGTVMYASSHTFGSGNNLMTRDNASNDGLTHKIIAVITDSPLKPMLFQDREPLGALDTDAETPDGRRARNFSYWADCRFGVSQAFWGAAILMTITDTPTLTELDEHLTGICDRFRTFTLPKGADVDDALYLWEGWVPEANNFTILCNLGLAQRLDKLRTTDLVASGTGGAVVNNQYQNKFTLVPTSALGS